MMNPLPTEFVDRYRREGYVGRIPALSENEASAVLNRIDGFARRFQKNPGIVIRNKGHLKVMAVYETIFNDRILDAVESVLGPDILCWGASLFLKQAGDPGYVAWHQDNNYFGLSPPDVLTAWIALKPSTIENGAMMVIPGSHLVPPFPHQKSPSGSTNMLFGFDEIAVDVDEQKAVPLVLDVGEMSLHHTDIVHGSKRNLSNDRRVGLALRYVAAHVRHNGPLNTATLVRGTTRLGFWQPEPVPTRDYDPEIIAWADAPVGSTPKGQTPANHNDVNAHRSSFSTAKVSD